MGGICVTRIEQLESELKQKINELNGSLNAQYMLRETLKSKIKTLEEIDRLLKVIEANLKCSKEQIYMLERENRRLKLSCDEWVKRAIKLEFEVLRARNATKE